MISDVIILREECVAVGYRLVQGAARENCLGTDIFSSEVTKHVCMSGFDTCIRGVAEVYISDLTM